MSTYLVSDLKKLFIFCDSMDSLRQSATKQVSIPTSKEAEKIITYCSRYSLEISKQLKGILTGIEDSHHIEYHHRLAVRQEYILVQQNIISHQEKIANRQQSLVLEKRTAAYMETYFSEIIKEYPREQDFSFFFCTDEAKKNDYYTIKSDSLVFDEIESLQGWIDHFHFPDPSVNHKIDDTVFDIFVDVGCKIFPIEDDTCSIDLVFTLSYINEWGVDVDEQIIFSGMGLDHLHAFFVDFIQEHRGVNDVLIYEKNDLYEYELDESLEDVHIREKSRDFSKELYFALLTYTDTQTHAIDKVRILSYINEHPEWRHFLRKSIDERSLGRLQYLLGHNIGEVFYLKLAVDKSADGIEIYGGKFKHNVEGIRQLIMHIEKICKKSCKESFTGRKDISFTVFGKIITADKVSLKIKFFDHKTEKHTFYVNIGHEQLLGLLTLLAEKNGPIDTAFTWENDYYKDDDDEEVV